VVKGKKVDFKCLVGKGKEFYSNIKNNLLQPKINNGKNLIKGNPVARQSSSLLQLRKMILGFFFANLCPFVFFV
jgi:hypothetical protein